jgi:hypothetical protein
MTNDPNDMNAPLTRGELREELANHPTKTDLREAIAELRTELRTELATKAELREIARELREDFAHMMRSMQEHMLAQIAALFDPYKDHEPRIAALEATGAPPPKRRRRGA